MLSKNKITIIDIAKEAGVSVGTVSAYINNTGFISKEKRKKIKRIIDKYDYEPNVIAKSLKINKTFTIGIVIPNIESPIFAYVVRAIEDVLICNDYNVILNSSEENPEREKKILRNLRAKRVDAIIVAPCGEENAEIFNEYKKYLNIVFIDRDLAGVKCDFVGSENYKSVNKAVSYLSKLGHKKIGIISLPKKITTGLERLDGYINAIKECNLIKYDELVKEGYFTKEEGYLKTNEILKSKVKPDALIVCNHMMTLGCLKSLKENNYKIPNDISLIGFDDLPWLDYFNPPLTVISQDVSSIGEKAAKLIIERLSHSIEKNLKSEPKKICFENKLVIRNSCIKRG